MPQINAFRRRGISHPLAPGGEATLDLEVLDAAAPALKQIDVYESSATPADVLERDDRAAAATGATSPQVISARSGCASRLSVGAIGTAGARRRRGVAAEAAASGITFLAASGDQGSADCTDASGDPAHQLAVNYPASSWWVTGVGGTNFALTRRIRSPGRLSGTTPACKPARRAAAG